MSRLRRYFSEGKPYFITNVAFKRRPILRDNVDLFWQAADSVSRRLSFELIAWVVMPDHFHLIVDATECSLSDFMKRIKLSFSRYFMIRRGATKGRLWQYRYWDHIIRNEKDLNNHLNYIHYNPVKHGLVTRPFDYPHSSIHKFAEYYQTDWGAKEEVEFNGDFGE